MKKQFLLSIALLLSVLASCTNYDFIETGTAREDRTLTMYQVMERDTYNFDSVMVMIKHAGLEPVFKGESTYGKNLTFLALTNHGIRAYLMSKDLKRVTDIPAEDCKQVLLSHLIQEVILRDELPKGEPSQNMEESVIGKGGKKYETLSGKQLWLYGWVGSFNDVPKVGATAIYVVSPETQKNTHVQTTDLHTANGVMQVLPYDFRPFDF